MKLRTVVFGKLLLVLGLLTVSCATGHGIGTGHWQPEVELPPVATEVVGGLFHTCLRRTDGSVDCWGIESGDDQKDRRRAFGQSSPPQETVSALAAGAFHTCAISEQTGQATCWGRDDAGQSTPPSGTFERLTAGGFHTCGRRPDGEITCWGLGSQPDTDETTDATERHTTDSSKREWAADPLDADQATAPDGTFVDVAAGHYHTCALREDGHVECWGRGGKGSATDPPDRKFETIAAGLDASCGVTTDAEIRCWGDVDFELEELDAEAEPAGLTLGHDHICVRRTDGSMDCLGPPTLVETVDLPDLLDDEPTRRDRRGSTRAHGGRVDQLASGAFHACVVGQRGQVACGGFGEAEDSAKPGAFGQADPPRIPRYKQLSVGAYQSCVQRRPNDDRRIRPFECWRGNLSAVESFRTKWTTPERHTGERVTDDGLTTGRVVVGGRSTCVKIDNGTYLGDGLACWDSHGSSTDIWTWQREKLRSEYHTRRGWRGPPPPMSGFDVGGAHRCVLLSSGRVDRVECFGQGSKPGIYEGPGDANQALGITQRTQYSTELELGERHGCIHSDKTGSCWGATRMRRYTPNRPDTTSITHGPHHGCWLEKGEARCSGRGSDPDVDEGRFDFDQAAPPSGAFRTLTAGRRYTCGIRRKDDRVKCWGDNRRGQLDAPDRKFATIAAAQLPPDIDGYGWTCGVTFDHEIHCWGASPEALSADPKRPERNSQLARLGAVEHVAAGGLHTCALDQKGTAACWGHSRNRATAVPFGASFQQIAGGLGYTCGIRDDATLACWGSLQSERVSLAGAFGLGVGRGETSPQPPAGRFDQVAAGRFFACALHLDDSVTCWGHGRQKELEVPEGHRFVDLAVGAHYGCALDHDGRVTCWGDDEGQRANPPDRLFTAISGGPGRVCGLPRDGAGIVCFGPKVGSPPASGAYDQISVGDSHACALTVDGTVDCWAAGSREARQKPRKAPPSAGQTNAPDGRFQNLSAGAHHTCATRDDGTLVCWGLGSDLHTAEHPLDFNQASARSTVIRNR